MRRRAAQSKAGDDIHSFGAKCERRRSRAMWRLHYEKTRNWLARKIWFVTVLTFKTEHVVGSAISLKMNLIFFNKNSSFYLISHWQPRTQIDNQKSQKSNSVPISMTRAAAIVYLEPMTKSGRRKARHWWPTKHATTSVNNACFTVLSRGSSAGQIPLKIWKAFPSYQS